MEGDNELLCNKSSIWEMISVNGVLNSCEILEKNCSFEPLRQKLGRLKCDCKDMGTLMAALVKYADSDSTKDPASDDEKTGKGRRNGNGKGQ